MGVSPRRFKSFPLRSYIPEAKHTPQQRTYRTGRLNSKGSRLCHKMLGDAARLRAIVPKGLPRARFLGRSGLPETLSTSTMRILALVGCLSDKGAVCTAFPFTVHVAGRQAVHRERATTPSPRFVKYRCSIRPVLGRGTGAEHTPPKASGPSFLPPVARDYGLTSSGPRCKVTRITTRGARV